MPKDKEEEAHKSNEEGNKAEKSGKEKAGSSGMQGPGKAAKKGSRQAPSTIAGTVRPRVVSSNIPALDWKFSIIACMSSMFLGMTTHLFGINGGLMLNDRFNLAFLMNKTVLEDIAKRIPTDMLGVAPLSQPWLKASLISDQNDYKFDFIWYHVVDVFWHALATGMLFVFVLVLCRHLHHQKRLKLDPYYVAACTAMLFACHPFTCEPVTYLSCRSTILGGVNFFQALAFLIIGVVLKHPIARLCFTLLALYCGAMSIWSNPECIALPALALFSVLLLKHPLAKWKETLAEHPFIVSIFALLSILVPFLTRLPMELTRAVYLFVPTLSSVSYAASQFKTFVFYYLRCYILPLGLSIDPPLTVAGNLSDPFVIAAIAIIAGLAFLIAKAKQPVLGLAAALVLAGILPHAFLLQPDVVADWVAYLPLSGMMLFLSYGICHVAQRSVRSATILLAGIGLVYFGLAQYRDWQWGSDYQLFQSGLALRPKSAFLHANLALEYLKRQQPDDAEKEAKLAVDYQPDMALARIAQAKVQLAKLKYEDAQKTLAQALELAQKQKLPAAVQAECKFADLQCLIGEQKQKEADQAFSKLFAEMPGDPRFLYLMGMLTFKMHDYEKAFQFLDRAVSSNPTLTECWEPMTTCAMELHSFETAYQAARSNLDTVGGPNATLMFARAAIDTRRDEEAEAVLKDFLAKDANNAKALYLLGRLHKRLGKTAEWKKDEAAASKLDPKIKENFPLPEIDMEDALKAAAESGKAAGGSAEKSAPDSHKTGAGSTEERKTEPGSAEKPGRDGDKTGAGSSAKSASGSSKTSGGRALNPDKEPGSKQEKPPGARAAENKDDKTK